MIAWLKRNFMIKQRPAHKGVAAMSQRELKEFVASREEVGRSHAEIAEELDIPLVAMRTLLLVKYE
jgi:DNA-directed RNA polymerase specialized sigma24 family protein